MRASHIAELEEAREIAEAAAKERGYVFGLCLERTSLVIKFISY